MEHFDLITILILIVFGLTIFLWISLKDNIYGCYQFFSFANKRLRDLKLKSDQSRNKKEKQAIQEIFVSIDGLKLVPLAEWKFKAQSLLLINKIASIYNPNVSRPMERARLAETFEALKEVSQKILKLIRLPGIGFLTQFRLIQFFENHKESHNRSLGIFSVVFIKMERWFFKSLVVQFQLLVGEAAIAIFSQTSSGEEIEAEKILAEWDYFEKEPDRSLSKDVQQIAESSKKEIIFSVQPISWKEAGKIYLNLADQIARYYHPDSEFPIYEMRVCDLLKSVSSFLEELGKRAQRPAFKNILKIRIIQITQAKEIVLPLGNDKLLKWVNRYQLGQITKWSHTLFKVLQKKQPGILLRDVVFSVIKEGGRRWLVLYIHGKIAVESNKLYGH